VLLFSACSTKKSFAICAGIPDHLPIPTRVTWLSLNSLTNSGLFATDICACVSECVRTTDNQESRCYLFSIVYQDLRQDYSAAGITICLLLAPLIVCHHNVMDTLLRHTLL
jgi:hypothetical protein